MKLSLNFNEVNPIFCPCLSLIASVSVKNSAGMSSSTTSIGIILFKNDGLCIISLEKSIKILFFSSKLPT